MRRCESASCVKLVQPIAAEIQNEPKFLLQGAYLVSTGGFDNSRTNRYNPAPVEEVRYGDQTWEEMFNRWFQSPRFPGPSSEVRVDDSLETSRDFRDNVSGRHR